jgi:hypothetical protein
MHVHFLKDQQTESYLFKRSFSLRSACCSYACIVHVGMEGTGTNRIGQLKERYEAYAHTAFLNPD